MSYDLYFWRYEDESAPSTGAREVYEGLSDGVTPKGLASLVVEDVKSAVADVMGRAGWTQDGVFWERKGVIAEIYVEDRHVQVCLRGKWTGDDANRLIDVMSGFGFPLYDPQTSERFQA